MSVIRWIIILITAPGRFVLASWFIASDIVERRKVDWGEVADWVWLRRQ